VRYVSSMEPLHRALATAIAIVALASPLARAHEVHGRPLMVKPLKGKQLSVGPVAVPSGK